MRKISCQLCQFATVLATPSSVILNPRLHVSLSACGLQGYHLNCALAKDAWVIGQAFRRSRAGGSNIAPRPSVLPALGNERKSLGCRGVQVPTLLMRRF